MATMVLTAVGTFVGGPIGAAVGAAVGMAIDYKIFAPKARHGPRMGDLAVQTSSYGSAIPKIFGTMRVAGTVIWATDLKEQRKSSGGGKGRPKVINYSYSVGFAVALSARRLRGVKRIWADGKLLRGAAGDFKTQTKFRLYLGDEEQAADPLIVSAEGAGQAPAYRGLAYAVFEDFQLEDYGNRIPSLTFEVEADAGTVTIGGIAASLSGGAVTDEQTPALGGYAASGDSVRGAVEGLAALVPLSLRQAGGALVLSGADGAGVPVSKAERTGPGEIVRRAAGAVPGEVSLSYYDPALDYQTGLQRASFGGAGARGEAVSLPASLSAAAAKRFAEGRLAAAWAERSTAKVELGWRGIGRAAGTSVRLEEARGLWRVRRWTLGAMSVKLELARMAGAVPDGVAATPGRPVTEPDLLPGPTVVKLYDLPLVLGATAAWVFAFAAGSEAGWRRAALLASFDEGASWSEAGGTAAPAVMGTVVDVLAAAGSALFDERSSLVVELLHDAMWLEGRSDAALAGGANLAVVGRELIQFGRVEPLGGGRFRLSRLLRGRRGTEWAAALHQAGEDFALVEEASLVPLQVPAGTAGSARLIASGIGDGEPVEASLVLEGGGESVRTPSPVHLRVDAAGGGDVLLTWVRRSRLGWRWTSGSDTPLGEEREAYVVTISAGGVVRRRVETAVPSYSYSAAEQTADGGAGARIVEVVQVGTYAASRAASLAFEV